MYRSRKGCYIYFYEFLQQSYGIDIISEMTQRDGTGREEGGGFRMGNTCIPVVDSC